MLPPITKILSRKPAPTVANGLTTSQHLGVPNYDKTLMQYEAYIDALAACGCEVRILEADERFPDGHFVEDAAVIFRELAFICRPRSVARVGEVETIAEALSDLHVVMVEGAEAFVEGGDVLFCADRILIGLGERTNRAGAEQLASALRDVQADIQVELVPFEGVLHLKTGMTALSDALILQSCHFKSDFQVDFVETVVLPQEESYAADVLPINDALLIPRGYPTVEGLATRYYSDVFALDMSEFEKMDGGLTCLSLRY